MTNTYKFNVNINLENPPATLNNIQGFDLSH